MELQEVSYSDSETKTASESYDPSLAYRILEEDFSKVIQDLTYHNRLGHYANEFQRLLNAVKEAHEREQELLKKNKALQDQISANSSKLSAAFKLSQSDKQTIQQFKQELDGAWRMIDTAHTREQTAQETIENLRYQVARLTQELESSRKMDSDQDQELGTLNKNKEALLRDKELLLSEIANAREKYTVCLKYQDELEKRNDAAETKISNMMTELETHKTELAKEKRFKERVEEELKEAKNEISQKKDEIQHLTYQATSATKMLTKMEHNVREDKQVIDKLNKELQVLQNTMRLLKLEYEQMSSNYEDSQQNLAAKNQELKAERELMSKMRTEMKKLMNAKDSVESKVAVLMNEKGMLELRKKELQTKAQTLERETAEIKQTLNNNKNVVNNFVREKDKLTRIIQKTTETSHEQQKLVSLYELDNKKLQEELRDQLDNLAKSRGEAASLQNEKDRLIAETTSLNTQIQDQAEELRLKEMELMDYKKKIANTEAKIKLQTVMFEQVRSERNNLSKNLMEANDEINELKHMIKVRYFQVEQLKEDIRNKETLLIKREFALKKESKEKEDLKTEMQKVINALKEKKEQASQLMQEQDRLQKIIQEADKDRVRLNKDLNQISNERDILGTQLVRRNDELTLLYEKIKILEFTLQKGEAQYDQRLEDIRLLKIEIKKLRQEKAMLARSMNNTADLRQELFHLERDFIRERLKCRVLEEEIQNPLNVHRWRKLECSDPTTLELIQKIQLLQKRLIAASEEAVKREIQLKETERLYTNLKQILARQPGPECMGKLKKCQTVLRERGIKMKCLVAELTMYENQLSGCKFEKAKSEKELIEIKKKYFDLKKREQKVKQREKELDQEKTYLPVLEPITGAPKAKFVGAGFNFATRPIMRRPSCELNA